MFIETVKSINNAEVIFIVRSVPTLNDATWTEAKIVGIDATATLMENGIDGPLPGTVLSRCSDEVRNLVLDADLIVNIEEGNLPREPDPPFLTEQGRRLYRSLQKTNS